MCDTTPISIHSRAQKYSVFISKMLISLEKTSCFCWFFKMPYISTTKGDIKIFSAAFFDLWDAYYTLSTVVGSLTHFLMSLIGLHDHDVIYPLKLQSNILLENGYHRKETICQICCKTAENIAFLYDIRSRIDRGGVLVTGGGVLVYYRG